MPEKDKKLSNRILGGSFLASLLLNLGWMAWVSHSDIFGSTRALETLHETRIKVFQPIPLKPKRHQAPPPVTPPPPPPKQQAQRPKFKPLRTITRLPKPPPQANLRPEPVRTHPQPHPAMSHPQPQPAMAHPQPAVASHQPEPVITSHPIRVATTPNLHTTSPLTVPYAPPNFGSPGPVNPGPAPVADPIKPPATGEHQPPASAPTGPLKPQQVQVMDPPRTNPAPSVEPPTPKLPSHPEGWVPVDVQEASPLGSFDSPEVPQEDADGISGKTMRVTWVVDEKGHAKSVHTAKSSGNAEVDRICEAIIKRMKFQPAIQDHLYREAHLYHEFSF